jgi:hypothetical protein
MSKRRVGLTVSAWAVALGARLALLLAGPACPVLPGLLLWTVALLAGGTLAVCYWRAVGTWHGLVLAWLAYAASRLLGASLAWSPIPFVRDNVAFLALALAVDAALGGWTAAVLLSFRRDVSVAYLVIFFGIGPLALRSLLGSAGSVYNLLFAGSPAASASTFNLAEPLLMSLSCLATLGFVTFLPQLFRLLYRELRGQASPQPPHPLHESPRGTAK